MGNLTTAERGTLKLLLDALSGDPVAINTLFSVSDLNGQRVSEMTLLRGLSGDAQALNALFSLSDPVLNYLTTAQRAKLQTLLLGYMGDASSLDALSGSFAPYNFLTDPQWLGRWEPGSLADQVGGPFGSLVAQGGAVTTTANVIDGNATWDFTAASGIRLESANFNPALQYFGPWTSIIVAKATGAAGDKLFDNLNAGGTGISFNDAGHFIFQDGNNVLVAATPTNFNCLTWYSHAAGSRTAVGNSAYTTYLGNINGVLQGITIGANRGGTNSGGWRVAGVYLIEGQMNAPLASGLFAYLRAKFPSILASATPPPAFSVDQVSRGSLPAGAFDIILIGGQSNNTCSATGTTPAAPAANTYMLGHDNTITAMAQIYDGGGAGYLDGICRTADQLGGNATSLLNAYTAATGRPVLAIPSACGGSSLVSAATFNVWDPAYPRGNKLRNSLFWSAVARLKNAIALGGTFRFLWWYQGEQEALGGVTAAFASKTDSILSQLLSNAGAGKRIMLQILSDNVGLALPGDVAAVQAAQASLASPGIYVIGAKNNNTGADNIHINGVGCDQIGNAAAASVLAQTPGTGWY